MGYSALTNRLVGFLVIHCIPGHPPHFEVLSDVQVMINISLRKPH